MKAAVLYGNEDIRYTDFEEKKTGPGEVKIRVRAAGICGSDIPRVLQNGAHFYPVVLGHEFSGDVVELGEGVSSLKIGDRVSAAPLLPCMKCGDCQRGNFSLCKNYGFIGSREQGGFADYVVLPEKNAVRFADTVSYEQGAMFEPSTVALHGILCGSRLPCGENVAILGGGTIGLFAAQWARIYGAKRVTVFDIVPSRLELARRLGADETVNTGEAGWMEKALEATGGEGFGCVFETAGAVPTMKSAFPLAKNKGSVCFIGTPKKDVFFTPREWEELNRKELRVTGSWMSYSAPFPGAEWQLTAHFFDTGQLLFDPELIDRIFPMSRAAEAFSLFHEPSRIRGKIMLVNEEKGKVFEHGNG